MRTIWIAPLLWLAACSGKSDREQKPPPVDAAVSYAAPLDARGVDPVWGLTVRGGGDLALSRPNQPVVSATAPGATITPHQASWTGKMADGQAMTVTFFASSCSDGTSAATYPFAVEVDLPDQSPLTGCGGRPARR